LQVTKARALKLSSVLTGLHGVTGRDIMDRLIAGERNPKVLAECARTRARRKIPSSARPSKELCATRPANSATTSPPNPNQRTPLRPGHRQPHP
jgi:hypothetical protein